MWFLCYFLSIEVVVEPFKYLGTLDKKVRRLTQEVVEKGGASTSILVSSSQLEMRTMTKKGYNNWRSLRRSFKKVRRRLRVVFVRCAKINLTFIKKWLSP